MEQFYSVAQLARIAGLHPNVIYRDVRFGKLPSYKLLNTIQGTVRISATDAREYLVRKNKSSSAGVLARHAQNSLLRLGEYTSRELAKVLAVSRGKSDQLMLGGDFPVSPTARRGIKGLKRVNAVKTVDLEQWLETKKGGRE